MQPTVALPTGFAGPNLIRDAWPRAIGSNFTTIVAGSDFLHYPDQADAIHELASAGFNIILQINWWIPFTEGEIAWNSSAVGMYYNVSLLQLLEAHIDWICSFVDPADLPGVILSDEEPGASLYHFFTDQGLRRHNSTYHSETGFWLRSGVGNETETVVLEEWLNDKVLWFFNHLYDHMKSIWPAVNVYQFMFSMPDVRYPDITQLKCDGNWGDYYFAGGAQNVFYLYDNVRRQKTALQDREYHLTIWGEEAWPWEVYSFQGGFEHVRRNTWAAYLSGVDALYWFTWHYEHGWIWERNDTLVKRMFLYLDRLTREMEKLPVFRPQPRVLLVLGTEMLMPELGMYASLGLFREWDAVYPQALLHMNLSPNQYDLIVVNDKKYADEVIEKLNDYVRIGGNLAILGGFGSRNGWYANDTRSTRFLAEQGIDEKLVKGPCVINTTGPNLLGLDLQYNGSEFMTWGIPSSSLTGDHHPMGNLYIRDENGTPRPSSNLPIVLYHNSSGPQEGWTLYWGLIRTVSSNPVHDVVPAFINASEWVATRYLFREVTRAFAENLLHLNASTSIPSSEYMLITESEIDNDAVLAGICNFYNETRNINYTLDLSRFDLPEGSYWIRSLDENLSLGVHESSGSLLQVPVSVAANGTRLLHISQNSTAPPFAVNVFPPIPTDEEAEDLWTTETTTTTTTTTTTSTTTTTTTTATTTSITSTTTTIGSTTTTTTATTGLLLLGAGLGVAFVIVIALLAAKKRRPP